MAFLLELLSGGSRSGAAIQPQLPIAVGDVRDIRADQATVAVDVLANDLNVGGAVVTIPGAVTGASAMVDADGRTILVTRPGPGAGNYSLTYRATVAGAGFSEAILSGTIATVPPQPVAVDDTRNLSSVELSVRVNVLANDSNVNGAEVTIPSPASGATAMVESDQRIRVERIGTGAGAYSLTYRATTDGGFAQAILSGSIAAYVSAGIPVFGGTTGAPGSQINARAGTTASPGNIISALAGTSGAEVIFMDATGSASGGATATASALIAASGLFLATDGDDGNLGTIGAPFGTLSYAMGQVSAGQTLYLRGGTYQRATATTWTKSGTVGSRVTVASYPGEVAILDANLADFQTTGQNKWSLDPSGGATETYRSAASYATPDSWIGSIVIGGVLYRLLRYTSLTALRSTTYTWRFDGEYYRGPGFIVHTDGRIYIRLQNLASPRNAGVPAAAPAGAAIRNTPPSAGGFDPNDFVINLSPVGKENDPAGDMFTVAASNLTFERLAFHGGDRGPLTSGRSNITYQNCRMHGQRINVRLNSGNDNIQILACDADTGVPPWISWHEVKDGTDESGFGGEDGHPGMKLSFMTIDQSNNTNVLVQDCLIRSAFDGMASPGTGCNNIRLLNNTWDLLIDDVMQFKGDATNLEVAYNRINGPGPGYDGSASSSAASKWFHHNIIDVRRDEFGYRNGKSVSNEPAWRDGHIPFATHSASGNMPAKVYNNTILYVNTHNNDGCRIERQGGKTAGVHEAYNNIALGYGAHSYIRGVDVSATSQKLDYQIIWNTGSYVSGHPFREWPDGTGTPNTHYTSLAAWRASAGFGASQAVYPPGFEANSKQADPLLGNPDAGDYRPSTSGPAASGAKSLTTTGWPGATSAAWFGAVDPAASTGLGNVGRRGTAGPGA